MKLRCGQLRKLANILTAVITISAVSSALAQEAGIENEYATVQFMDATWGSRHTELGKELLGIVKKSLGDQGSIQVVPWEKRPDLGYQKVIYEDSSGRLWQITPEVVNTGGHDGLEFVTPPLESEADIDLLEKILKGFKRTKKVMRGLRSSNHITVGVSKLISDESNIDRLVKLILTIENHWPEIFQVFDPIRYGHAINRFAVPLAVDQQDLLSALQALPRSQRSLEKVSRTFLKYEERERALRDPDGKNSSRMWKYRAANYGKLFGLNGVDFLPVIEFRIGDLESGSRLRAKIAFLRALVKLEGLDDVFRAPFGRHPLDVETANEKLKRLVTNAPSRWLESLGLSSLTVSRLKQTALAGEQRRELDLIDPNEPVEWNGKKVTMGYETEFSNEYRGDLVQKNLKTGLLSLGRGAPHYLAPNVDTEGISNIEVRSLGGEWRLSELLEQMTETKTELGDHLRGFHAHIFIPKEAIEAVGIENFRAWIGLLGDAIFAWRLENKRTFYSLLQTSQSRNGVTEGELDERATVRVQVARDGGYYDVEIRGYMDDQYKIGHAIQSLLTFLKFPQHAWLSLDEQLDLRVPRASLVETLDRFSALYGGEKLSEGEKAKVGKVLNSFNLKHFLPLNGFERLAQLSAGERKQFRDATQEFSRKTLNYVRKFGRGEMGEDEFKNQFLFQMKLWAQAARLTERLEERLIVLSSKTRNAFQDTSNIREALKSSDHRIESLASSQLDSLTPESRAYIDKSIIRDLPRFDLEATLSSRSAINYRTTQLAAAKLLSLPVKERLATIERILKKRSDLTEAARIALFTSDEKWMMTFLKKISASRNAGAKSFVSSVVEGSASAVTAQFAGDFIRENAKRNFTNLDKGLIRALFKRTDAAALNQIKNQIPILGKVFGSLLEYGGSSLIYAKRAMEEGDEALRLAAVVHFTAYQSQQYAQEILGPALSDPSKKVRELAASGMNLSDRWHRDGGKWLRVALNSKDPKVFAEASEALRFMELHSISETDKNSLVPTILKLLAGDETSQLDQLKSVVLMSRWENPRIQKWTLEAAREAITRRSWTEADAYLRHLAGCTIPGALALLLESVENPHLRIAALEGLSARTDPKSLEVLLTATGARETEEKVLALRMLSSRSENEALEKIEGLISSENPGVRKAATHAKEAFLRNRLKKYGSVSPTCRDAFPR